MPDYQISEKAYAKIIFHAAKYPHLCVNGVLLADDTSSSSSESTVIIVDAIPLFHQCLYVTPMAEVALLQIDVYAERHNLVIAGYYTASDNLDENSVERAPAAKVADRIHDNYKKSCFVIVDNKLMTLNHQRPAIKVFERLENASRWTAARYNLQNKTGTLQAVSALLKRGAMKDIVDFDNHLDNPECDWTNTFLDKSLSQIMSMY